MQTDVDSSETERFVPSSEPALTDRIITIGRSYGSGGRSVGRLLAEKLNIPYYDAALLEETAKHSGLSQKYLAGMDEKPVSSTMLYQYGFNFNHDSFLENQARQAQQEVVAMVAAKGPCVIVGRRADQVLKDSTNLVRIFITGSKESRVQRISERDHLTEKESAAKLERIDRERAAYYNLYAESHWGEAETYDLCIETDRLGIEGAVDVILTVVKAMEQA
ncbi:MAG: cytidylate kinase-like family protein [Clostridiales bacterium]|nr:cytidylate kinase-like family protein [Clostridiales bacterium]